MREKVVREMRWTIRKQKDYCFLCRWISGDADGSYLFLRLSVCDASLLPLSVLQQLLEADQVGLQELQFGWEQLGSFLLGCHSSQFIRLQVGGGCQAESRQTGDLLLDLLEHLLYMSTQTWITGQHLLCLRSVKAAQSFIFNVSVVSVIEALQQIWMRHVTSSVCFCLQQSFIQTWRVTVFNSWNFNGGSGYTLCVSREENTCQSFEWGTD